MSTTKSLVVNLTPDSLNTLYENNYVLCVAKMVDDQYPVIWEGRKKLLEINNFKWSPEYQPFATNSFAAGFLVKASTSTQAVTGGQTCTLSAAGYLGSATSTVDVSKPLHLKNEYGTIHPGVSMVSPNGKVSPIYVAPLGAVKGNAALLPKEKLRIWFQQNIESATMISEVKSAYVDVDFTGADYHEVTYENEKWVVQK